MFWEFTKFILRKIFVNTKNKGKIFLTALTGVSKYLIICAILFGKTYFVSCKIALNFRGIDRIPQKCGRCGSYISDSEVCRCYSWISLACSSFHNFWCNQAKENNVIYDKIYGILDLRFAEFVSRSNLHLVRLPRVSIAQVYCQFLRKWIIHNHFFPFAAFL